MNKEHHYQQCARCVMDTTAQSIVFDKEGVCNFCKGYDSVASRTILKPAAERESFLKKVISQIKETGKADKYDCIVGLSGGVDSSCVAVLAKEFGLRPLVVHFDNGWNSELAIKNIENLIQKLDYELYTYVINWEDFKELQLAYFRSSVIDIEVTTDQLIAATLLEIAKKFNIKYILSGNNFRTEYIMPDEWVCDHKIDHTNLKNIYARFGSGKKIIFPKISATEYYLMNEYYNMEFVPLLNLIDFDLHKMKDRLIKEFAYKPYEYKHYESVFTRFYQGYILPQKFNIDKRKAHLSNLICAHLTTRAEALSELEKPPYPVDEQQADKEYVLKKWDMKREEFDEIMKMPLRSHDEFGYDTISAWAKWKVRLRLIYLYKFAYPLGLKKPVPKFYFNG